MPAGSETTSADALITEEAPTEGFLDRLADHLLDRGLAASVIYFGAQKRVSVLNRSRRDLHDSVYLAPKQDLTLWFCWSTGEAITPVTEITQAGALIAGTLMPDA